MYSVSTSTSTVTMWHLSVKLWSVVRQFLVAMVVILLTIITLVCAVKISLFKKPLNVFERGRDKVKSAPVRSYKTKLQSLQAMLQWCVIMIVKNLIQIQYFKSYSQQQHPQSLSLVSSCVAYIHFWRLPILLSLHMALAVNTLKYKMIPKRRTFS